MSSRNNWANMGMSSRRAARGGNSISIVLRPSARPSWNSPRRAKSTSRHAHVAITRNGKERSNRTLARSACTSGGIVSAPLSSRVPRPGVSAGGAAASAVTVELIKSPPSTEQSSGIKRPARSGSNPKWIVLASCCRPAPDGPITATLQRHSAASVACARARFSAGLAPASRSSENLREYARRKPRNCSCNCSDSLGAVS